MRARRVTMVPNHIDEPLAAVVVVKQRRVKSARIDVSALGPRAFNRRRGDDVVVRVLEVSVEPFDVGVDEPEFPVGVGETGGPDAAGIRLAAQVEQRGAVKRTRDEPPVHEIARVMDLHARIPFERRRRDVIVLAHADYRRVRVEAGQDRIADHRGGTQRAAHSMPRRKISRISGTSNSAATWPSEL